MSIFRIFAYVVLVPLVCILVNGDQIQHVFNDESVEATHFNYINNSNFTIMNLSDLELKDEFTMLSHPSFSNYQVRIKKTDFCDPTVK